MYSGSSQLVYYAVYAQGPQFFINASYARARAHTCPHTPTQGDLLVQADPVEHSRHSSSSGRTGGGIPAVEAAGIPVVEVHEGAKRPGMRIIPDSPENTTHQSKSLPHSAAHTSQPRRRLRGRRPRATLTPSTCMQRAAPSIACGSGNTLGESCCRTWRRLRAKYGRRPQTTTSAMDATLRVEQAPLAQ